MLKCTVALGFGTIGLAAAGATAHADTITIQKGDTVWGYSQRYHVTMGDIVKANNLKNPNLIIAGKTIYIPTSGGLQCFKHGGHGQFNGDEHRY